MKRHSKKMQAKARKCTVQEVRGCEGVYRVYSPSGNTYIATAEHCSCDWARYHPDLICSHRMAVLNHIEEQKKGRRLSFWSTEDDAQRQHRPMKAALDVWATSRAM